MTANTAGHEYVDVWWVPSCGAIHIERNPRQITFDCPDGVEPGSADQREDT